MPTWCLPITLSKGLLILVLVFIVLEYLYGTISDTKRWEYIFTTNSTRFPVEVKQFHSPLISVLVAGSKNSGNVSSANSTKEGGGKVQADLVVTVDSIAPGPNTSMWPEGDLATKYISTELPSCPEIVPNLRGRIEVIKFPVPTIQELEKRFSWLKTGGHWYPDFCKTSKKIAIVVPFRCRGEHLLLFLQHMHPFLKKQQLDYRIFIIEQEGEGAFNRAMLMNVGYKEALKLDNFDCFIFHDVDLLPEDDRNLYTCGTQPRHMSAAVDIFKYKLPYRDIFGGVSAITKEHFQLLNGFSNSFWGWGGEDDDMSNRIRYHNLHISRYPITIARYTMLTHVKDRPSPNRYEILKAGKAKYNTDGLNNLRYSIKEMKQNPLYTWLLVEVDPPS